MAKDDTDDLKAQLKAKRAKTAGPIDPRDYLSTGSTLLNLALTNRANAGFAKGKYFWIVGDSTSGKTFFSLTCLAEANINKNFDGYDFYHDNNEDGALMDIGKYFGQGVAERLKPAATDKAGNPTPSRTAEEFYYNLDNNFKKSKKRNKGFIEILDSENGLDSDSSRDKFDEQKAAHEKGKDTAGSYGDGKAKLHSQNIRRAIPELRDTKSILIIISQTRDNIGFGFDPKTVSGGRALKFYATAEIWTSVKEKLKKRVKGKDRDVGILVEVRVKKNRFTGRNRTIHIPIYYSYGFDDVGSCVDYLLKEEHWKKSKVDEGKYKCPEFRFKGDRDAIVAHIEENGLEKDLREIVETVWHEIDAACEIQRKPRYT